MHEPFSEFLASLQGCSGFRRTDNRNIFQGFIVAEEVVDAFYQRVFRTHYQHVDAVFKDKTFDGFEVIGFDGYVFAYLLRSGIARSDVQLFYFRTLCDFPCQCMFASA